MSLNADDLSVVLSGWFENGQRISEMKEHEVYKNFRVSDVFYGVEEKKDEERG